VATSVYPDGMHGSCAAMYRPEARELLVEYELPRQDVVPAVASYWYVKTKDVVQPGPRKDSEIRKLYEKLLARVTLRTLAEAFDVAPVTLVDGIVFNGYVSAKDRATGKPVRPLVMSVHATREAFSEIVLDEPELDPKACLTGHLNAIISEHPYDLEPVRPVVQFDRLAGSRVALANDWTLPGLPRPSAAVAAPMAISLVAPGRLIGSSSRPVT
jgi:restriction system protein